MAKSIKAKETKKDNLEKMIEGLQYIKFLQSHLPHEIKIMSDNNRIYCRLLPGKEDLKRLEKLGWKYGGGELYFSTIPF